MKGKFLGSTILPLIAAGLLVVACNGTTTNNPGPSTAFAVLRLAGNGAPDTSFGGSGFVTTDINTTLFDFALALAVQPADNKLIAGGSSGLSGQGVLALVRYNQDGTLDAAGFGTGGTGGVVTAPLPSGWSSASASAIAVQADNKIVVAALVSSPSSTTGIAVYRYNTDGTPDATFGGGTGLAPVQTIGPGLAGDTCAMVLQGTTSPNIVVAGSSTNGNLVLFRFDATGALDPTFGTGGAATVSVGSGAQATPPALAFQSVGGNAGKIIAVSGNSTDHVMVRYSADGVPDATFGANGVIVTDAGGVDFANAVAVQSDDKIVVAGHANVNFTLDTSDISLIRYNADGSLDSTFGPANTGIVTTDLGKFDNAFSVALVSPAAANTQILVAGNTGSGGVAQIAVLRYNTDGTLDTTFNPGGAIPGVLVPPILGPSNIASGNAVIQTTLGVVVAGYD